jgi:hypothetical protein
MVLYAQYLVKTHDFVDNFRDLRDMGPRHPLPTFQGQLSSALPAHSPDLLRGGAAISRIQTRRVSVWQIASLIQLNPCDAW